MLSGILLNDVRPSGILIGLNLANVRHFKKFKFFLDRIVISYQASTEGRTHFGIRG